MKHYCKYLIDNNLILWEISNSKDAFNFLLWYKEKCLFWIRKSHTSYYFEFEILEKKFIYFKWKSRQACEVCPTCHGFGELSKPPYDDSGICPECNGSGHANERN